MRVLSLFDGMNTGRQALENQGFKIGKYYSSEIKTYARFIYFRKNKTNFKLNTMKQTLHAMSIEN